MINSVCRRIQSELGHPTVLINNAGLTRGRNLIFTTENDVALTLHTNLHAHFHLLREFLPKMVEANHGHIVTVASAAGYIGPPGLVDYAASKAGAIAVHEVGRRAHAHLSGRRNTKDQSVGLGFGAHPPLQRAARPHNFDLPELCEYANV